jgi:coenzyme F420-0:L-glutamate ligase/coenzyme F420-1:gamma-L-glutamate ligase
MDTIFSRWSIRKFQPQPVPEESIRRMLAAAHAAPSAHNSRPWRFVILRDAAARRSLAEGMADAYRRDAEADGRTPDAVEARNRRSVERITGAPLAILACMDEACLPADAGRGAQGERLLLVQSVAAAVQNLLLAAVGEGLGACWLCAPAFCPRAVSESLALPAGWEPQALILIGLPGEAPSRPDGRALDEAVLWR